MRNGFITKRQILVFLAVVQMLCLSGCGDTNSASENRANRAKIKYLKSYTEFFKKQAKTQYGEDATVKKINVKTYKYNMGLMQAYKTEVKNYLYGVITANGETFDAALDVYGTHQILTTKNYGLIEESLKVFFGYLNLDIVAADVTTFEYGREYLPDDILTYEDMLRLEIDTNVYIYVTNQLDSIAESDFEKLKVYWEASKRNSGRSDVVVIQVNSDKLNEVNKMKFRNANIVLDHNIYLSYIRLYFNNSLEKFSFKYER